MFGQINIGRASRVSWEFAVYSVIHFNCVFSLYYAGKYHDKQIETRKAYTVHISTPLSI